MTPEELASVERSWADLCRHGALLVDHLTASFKATDEPAARARWLVDAVGELVGLLSAPSQLGAQARSLAPSWPDPGAAPCFSVEGRAWLDAAREVSATWTDRTDEAWRQAWLLLSEVLAAEALSPFAVLAPEP